MRLKHDIVLLGRLDDGLGYYRFVYNGGHTAYVGVMAQEVQTVAPEAVTRGADGYMRVSYDQLGLPFETYKQWLATRRAFAERETGRALIAGTRTRTTTMTMRIGGILAAAILIAAAFPARAQETYPTPEAAVKDLVDSAKAKTPGFGDRILGKDGAALLRSGDADEDAENLKEFNEAAAASTAIDDGPNGAKILRVGKNGWTLPLPLVKTDAGWRFDVAKGKEEMTNRRVGYNELSAIEACKAYVAAQDEYFRPDPTNGLREYARRFVSTPGTHDGLYWPPENQADISPLDGSLKTPTWLSVRARSRSLTTAITSASSPRRGRRLPAALFPTSSMAT